MEAVCFSIVALWLLSSLQILTFARGDICHLRTSLYKCITLYTVILSHGYQFASIQRSMDNHPESDLGHLCTAPAAVSLPAPPSSRRCSPFSRRCVSFEVLDFGLHLRPEELRKVLQEKIDEASQQRRCAVARVWTVLDGGGWLAGADGTSCHPACG